MIKIPATKAGLEAMGVLIEENTPLNATEIMGLSQVIDVCEMYRQITAKAGTGRSCTIRSSREFMTNGFTKR
jgi:transaldolase